MDVDAGALMPNPSVDDLATLAATIAGLTHEFLGQGARASLAWAFGWLMRPRNGACAGSASIARERQSGATGWSPYP
jgi:hypothetical protein